MCIEGATDQGLIAHPTVDARVLSLDTGRLIFSMRPPQWTDGMPVRVFVLADDNSLHLALASHHLVHYPRGRRRI